MSSTVLMRNVYDSLASLKTGRTRFEDEWNRFKSRSTLDLQGCWSGVWRSADRTREGPIRCVLTKIAPATYVASFCVRWFSRFPFSYDVQLRVTDQENRFDIEGAVDLGFLSGGVHHFKGQATQHDLWCEYVCRRDRGRLDLKRVS